MFSLILLEASGLAMVRTAQCPFQPATHGAEPPRLMHPPVGSRIKDCGFKPLRAFFFFSGLVLYLKI